MVSTRYERGAIPNGPTLALTTNLEKVVIDANLTRSVMKTVGEAEAHDGQKSGVASTWRVNVFDLGTELKLLTSPHK